MLKNTRVQVVFTLAIGMAMHPLSLRPALKPGLEFSGRTLLRLGVALYGARLTLGQLVDGGALPVMVAVLPLLPTLQCGEGRGEGRSLTQRWSMPPPLTLALSP